MGGNICKSCDNFTNLEEKDLSKNLVSKNSFNYNYNNNTFGDWGLGIGDWGLGIGPNPQSPIPNPQSPKVL